MWSIIPYWKTGWVFARGCTARIVILRALRWWPTSSWLTVKLEWLFLVRGKHTSLWATFGVRLVLPARVQTLPKALASVIVCQMCYRGLFRTRLPTQKLGYWCLWIDPYCIDQTDSAHTYEQICQMDKICKVSALTIIATAGEDSNYDIPGVGDRHRIAQQCAKIGGHKLVNTLDNAHIQILESKWAKRGWTYQEAILSRRRLVFTGQQVYFECRSMYAYEAFDFPLRKCIPKMASYSRRDSWMYVLGTVLELNQNAATAMCLF